VAAMFGGKLFGGSVLPASAAPVVIPLSRGFMESVTIDYSQLFS